MKLFELHSVTLTYHNHVVLKDVSLNISQGEFIGIIGSNGSGKSTLLNSLLKLKKPERGVVKFHSHPTGRPYKIGYTPQRHILSNDFPLTVLDIVLMASYHNNSLFPFQKKDEINHALDVLKYVECYNHKGKTFRELSGGEKQRVLLARALMNYPEVLIVDEPTDGLDIVRKSQIMDLIKKIHHEKKVTVIMVSHELEMLLDYVEKLYLIHNKLITPLNPKEENLINTIKQIY